MPTPSRTFRTIRLKPSTHPSREPVDEWTAVTKLRIEWESAHEHRDLLGRFLTEAGHRYHSLVESDPSGGWRIHFFAKPVALEYLEMIVGDSCGPGDPLELDPEWIVRLVETWP